jgi:hypothetical protein
VCLDELGVTLQRAGHTEAAADLAYLSGLRPISKNEGHIYALKTPRGCNKISVEVLHYVAVGAAYGGCGASGRSSRQSNLWVRSLSTCLDCCKSLPERTNSLS